MKRAAIALLLLSTACSSGPLCTPEQLEEITTFQTAVRRELDRPEVELFEAGLLFEIPVGWRIDDLDVHGRTGSGAQRVGDERRSAFLLHDGGDLRAIPWQEGHSVPDPRRGEIYRFVDRDPDDGWYVVAAGARLGGFEAIDRFALRDDVGMVLIGRRDDAQWIVVGDRVFTRWSFDTTLSPTLSRDGRWMAYVRRGVFSDALVVAPVDAPESARELVGEGRLDWPIDLSDDGLHWAGSGTDGEERLAILDGKVLGRFDKVLGPITANGRFVPVWKVWHGAKMALIIGSETTPWFDGIGWPESSADRRVSAFHARDGDQIHVFVGGERVLSHPQVIGLGLAPSGQTWAAATRDEDGIRVVQGTRVHGPFPPTERGVTVLVDDDATLTFFDEFGGDAAPRLYLDGEDVGAGFTQIEHPQLLRGGSYAFVGQAEGGSYLVTGVDRSGPWDWIGGRKVSSDGTRIAFVAGRGREVWRVVVAVR